MRLSKSTVNLCLLMCHYTVLFDNSNSMWNCRPLAVKISVGKWPVSTRLLLDKVSRVRSSLRCSWYPTTTCLDSVSPSQRCNLWGCTLAFMSCYICYCQSVIVSDQYTKTIHSKNWNVSITKTFIVWHANHSGKTCGKAIQACVWLFRVLTSIITNCRSVHACRSWT